MKGVIPDVVAQRLIAEIIMPYFERNDYAGGINAGVAQLMKLIEGEALPTPPSTNPGNQQNEHVFMFIFLGGLISGFMLSAIMGRVMGGILACLKKYSS